LQHALARYLETWFPDCESNPNGRSGRDILGTPGIWFECKTARLFRPLEWARQARRGALGCQCAQPKPCPLPVADWPVVVWFPDGTGEAQAGAAMAIVPLDSLMEMLTEAGYTAQVPKD